MAGNPLWGGAGAQGSMAGMVSLGIQFDGKQVASSLAGVGQQAADTVSRSISKGMKGVTKFDSAGLSRRLSNDIGEGVKKGMQSVAKDVKRGTSNIPKIKVAIDTEAAEQRIQDLIKQIDIWNEMIQAHNIKATYARDRLTASGVAIPEQRRAGYMMDLAKGKDTILKLQQKIQGAQSEAERLNESIIEAGSADLSPATQGITNLTGEMAVAGTVAKDSIAGLLGEAGAIAGKASMVIGVVVGGIKLIQRLSDEIKKGAQATYKAMISVGTVGIRAVQKAAGAIKKVKSFVQPFFDWFKQQAKRVLLFFGIHTWINAIRKVAQYAKESLIEMGNQFPIVKRQMAALDDMTNAVKASFAGMFAPIVQKALPHLQVIMGTLMNVFNQIGMFIAQIFGQSSYRMIVGFTGGLADGGDAAGGADKQLGKLRRTLASFDELEILKNDSPLGGIGGGIGAGGGKPIYQEVEIKPLFDGDFTKLGKELAKKFNKIIEGLDAKALAKTIGEHVNKAIALAKNFFTNANFVSLGKKIAELLNGLFANVNVKGLGDALGLAIKAALDTLKGIVTNFNWGNAGTGLSDFINGLIEKIDFPSLGTTLNTAVLGLIEGLREAITNFDWKGTGKTFADSVTNTFGVGNADNLWVNAGEGVGELTDGVLEFINSGINNFNFKQAGSDMATGLNAVFAGPTTRWAEIGETYAKMANAKLELTNTVIREFDWDQAGRNLGTAFNTMIKETNLDEAGFSFRAKTQGMLQAQVAAMGEIDDTTWEKLGKEAGKGLIGPDGLISRLTNLIVETIRMQKGVIRGALHEILAEIFNEKVADWIIPMKMDVALNPQSANNIKNLINSPFFQNFPQSFKNTLLAMDKMGGYGVGNAAQNAANAAKGALAGAAAKGALAGGYRKDTVLSHASGGTIKMPTLSWLGERSKQEVVIPLERDTGWADVLVDRLKEKGLTGTVSGDIHLTQPIFIGEGNLLGVLETIIDRQGRLRNQPVFLPG